MQTENQRNAENLLMNIRNFNERIDRKRKKVRALELAALPSAIVYDKDRVQGGCAENFAERVIIDACDLEQEIEEEIASMEDVKLRAYNISKALKEDEQTLILLYYFDGLLWEEVGNKMAYSESRIFELRATALENYGNLIDEY